MTTKLPHPGAREHAWLLYRYPDSEGLQMAAAAVLAREAKQQEALALVAHASSRNATLMRAQLALDAGDTGQVSHVVTDAMLACPTWGCLTFAPASQPTIVLTH